MAMMDEQTSQTQVLINMVIVGLGLGVMPQIYTLAVQNAAIREHMAAATAAVQFFRSIGSTMGVAVFGSVMLSIYHSSFRAGIPAGTPPLALKPFDNPLLLMQIRPQLDTAFGRYPGGGKLLATLMNNVRTSLEHSLQVIFIAGAIVMAITVFLNLFLPEIPLRGSKSASTELSD